MPTKIKVTKPKSQDSPSPAPAMPGEELDPGRMPGHWLLARMGKRVLRPGGVELTRSMLKSLDIQSGDLVVEFAPGLGLTAREALTSRPYSYIGVERDEAAAQLARRYLKGPGWQCLVGRAESTGLPSGSATVVFGEAMLTMQPATQKASIVEEAGRLLHSGGRYGIHELCLQPDNLAEEKKDEIMGVLSDAIRVGARPLTPSEWNNLLDDQGFKVESTVIAPMHLLEPGRFVRDEGLLRTFKFLLRVLRNPEARRRIRRMRSVFRTYRDNLGAIAMVGIKK